MEADIMVHQAQFPVKLLIVAAFIFTNCVSPVQEDDLPLFNAAQLQLQTENGLMMQQGNPFTGRAYTLCEETKDTAEIVGFRQGKEHGNWKKFYPGGRLMSTRFFDDGKKIGHYATWWPNGKQQLDYYFYDGEYEGRCREWNEQGIMVNERNYKKGYEEGPQKQFYDNGKIKSNYVMMDGKRYGLLGTKNCINVSDSIFK